LSSDAQALGSPTLEHYSWMPVRRILDFTTRLSQRFDCLRFFHIGYIRCVAFAGPASYRARRRTHRTSTTHPVWMNLQSSAVAVDRSAFREVAAILRAVVCTLNDWQS